MATMGDSNLHLTAWLTPRPRRSAQWWGAEELSSRAGLAVPSRGLLRIRSTTLVSKWIHAQRPPLSTAYQVMKGLDSEVPALWAVGMFRRSTSWYAFNQFERGHGARSEAFR